MASTGNVSVPLVGCGRARLDAASQALPTLGIFAIFRDEAMLITEWLWHHTAEGAQQFVLLDQQSTDNGVALARNFSQQHPALDVCVLSAPEERQQNRHYARHLHRFVTDWVLIVDIDEFVYARHGFATIPHFLASVRPSVGLVALPWRVFASAAPDPREPPSRLANLTWRHNYSNSGGSRWRQYKSLLRLRAVRALLGLNSTATLTEDVLPRGASGFAEVDLHHAVDGVHAHLSDGTPLRRLVLPSGPGCSTADAKTERPRDNLSSASLHGVPHGPCRREAAKVVMDPARDAELPLHLNHYRLGSCEFWFRVKMTRGGAEDISANRTIEFRDWPRFRAADKDARQVEDFELQTKRGPETWVAALASVQRQWPRRRDISGHVQTNDPANGKRSWRTAPNRCKDLVRSLIHHPNQS